MSKRFFFVLFSRLRAYAATSQVVVVVVSHHSPPRTEHMRSSDDGKRCCDARARAYALASRIKAAAAV